jgi:hypothetical protein
MEMVAPLVLMVIPLAPTRLEEPATEPVIVEPFMPKLTLFELLNTSESRVALNVPAEIETAPPAPGLGAESHNVCGPVALLVD